MTRLQVYRMCLMCKSSCIALGSVHALLCLFCVDSTYHTATSLQSANRLLHEEHYNTCMAQWIRLTETDAAPFSFIIEYKGVCVCVCVFMCVCSQSIQGTDWFKPCGISNFQETQYGVHAVIIILLLQLYIHSSRCEADVGRQEGSRHDSHEYRCREGKADSRKGSCPRSWRRQ